MSGHTPGPWAYQEGADAYTHIVRASGNRFICQLSQDRSGTAEANCRLIAAAPDMLALVVEALETAAPGTGFQARCREAIAKATGAA